MYLFRQITGISPRLSASLDFLRWTSAILVLIWHIRMLLFSYPDDVSSAGLFCKAFYFVTGFGNQAVMIFFVLSGYLVGGAAAEKLSGNSFSLTNYLVNRISRLYPVFGVALLLTAVFDLTGTSLFHNACSYRSEHQALCDLVNYNIDYSFSGRAFFSSLFMLQGFVLPPFGANWPLWSLSTEFWYYLLFPLLLLPFFLKEAKSRWLCILTLVLLIVLLSRNMYYLALFVVWLMGVAARRIQIPFKNSALAFGALVLALVNSRIGMGSTYLQDLLIGMGCMMVIVAIQNGGRGIEWGAGFSKRMAGFSYSLYCCHFPALVFFVALLSRHRDVHALSWSGRLLLAGLVTAACIGLAYLVSVFTEARTAYFRNHLKGWLASFKFLRGG